MKNVPYLVTEWEWLKVKLNLGSLMRQGKMRREMFNFVDPSTVICAIYSSPTVHLVDSKTSREDQLTYYSSWNDSIKKIVHEDDLPLHFRTT